MTGEKVTGLLVRVDGRAEVLSVPADWRELNAIIGASWGEVVRTILPGVLLWVDDEGRLAHKPANAGISHRLYPAVITGDVFIVGETNDGESDVASLTEPQLAELASWFTFAPSGRTV